MRYSLQTNLQDLITELTDEQLNQTIEWCRSHKETLTLPWVGRTIEDLQYLLIVCYQEQKDRDAYDYLTKDQLADMLGNDNAHYVWDGDDLLYLAHPHCDDRNY
jgi:hypothetical protein